MNQINFMGRRGPAAILSIVLVIASLAIIMTKGVKKNVDFEGGSKLTVIFTDNAINIGQVRDEVTQYEESAQVVTLKVEDKTKSEFSIKVKNPQIDERESDISPERRQNLEQAFSSLVSEDAEVLALIKKASKEELTEKLLKEDINSVTGTDAAKRAAYGELADKIKANVDAATTVRGLANSVDSENGSALARGLGLCFPAINRTTADQLNAQLMKYNPLNRNSGADYRDVVNNIMAARAAKGDFFDSFDFLSSIAVSEGEGSSQLANFFTSTYVLGKYRIIAIENFSASIAAELLAKAWEAVILALLGILVYLWLRFSLAFGVASVVALAHDITIALGVFALAGAELSNPVVAAFLTIVGYSLNDTIVVFDRIRDNMHHSKSSNLENLMNTSINQTLSRTLVTSLTTLFVVLVIYLFSGNETLENFSFPLLVGVIVGTYSSIFVASPTLLLWNEKYKPVTA